MTQAFRTDGADRPGGSEMVDWDLAVRIGSRLAGEGPAVPRDDAAAIVEELREESAAAGTKVTSFEISQPEVLIGLLIGGMMVYLFAALAIEAVGRAGGGVVEEVRRQFKEKPGIMDYTEKPDYAKAVDIVTGTSSFGGPLVVFLGAAWANFMTKDITD